MFTRIALGSILLIAAILRFYHLPHQGLIVFDEGAYIAEAKLLTTTSYTYKYGTSFRPGFNMLAVLASHVVGWSPFTGAGISAVLGVLTVVAVYGVSRQLFAQPAALLATALLATSTYHIFYSRVGLSNGAAVFFFTFGLLCWLHFTFTANRNRSLLFPFAAGLSFGYAFACHYSLMLYVGLCVVVDFRQAIQTRDYRGSMVLVAGTVIPVVGFIPLGQQEVWQELFRLHQTVQLNPASPAYFLRLLWRHEALLLLLYVLCGGMRVGQKVRQSQLDQEGYLYVIFMLGLIVLSVQAWRGAAAPRLMAPLLPLMAVLTGGAVISSMDVARLQRGRTLLWGGLLTLILMTGVGFNRGALAWQSKFEAAGLWLHTRYPTSSYTCDSWWPICGLYRLGREVHTLQDIYGQAPYPEFLFSSGNVAAGTLVAALDNPIVQHPLVAEENGPGTVQSGGLRDIPGVIRIYDLRPVRSPNPDGTQPSLLTAAESGDADTVAALVAQGAGVNARTMAGTTALMFAAAKGHTAIIEVLLAHRADVNATTRTGGTALMGAATNGHLQIVHTLLAHGAEVNARDTNGGTALMGAAANGHLAVVQTLLAAGADASAQYVNGKTALRMAQERGHTVIVRLLHEARAGGPQRSGLARDAPDHPAPPLSAEALLQSALQGDMRAVEVLLAAGIDPNEKSKTGETALMQAAVNGHLAIVHTLLAHGAEVNTKQANGWTALMGAADQGHSAVVKALLKHGADVNVRQAKDVTVLMLAASSGDLTTTQLLLAVGSDVNARTVTGMTALMWAAANGHLLAAQALLAWGADVNARDRLGETALMWAAANGHLAIVQTLLTGGANVDGKRNDGVTALMRGAANGHAHTVQTLLAKGANVNAKTQDGATALMGAAVDGHTAIVQALLDHGAEVNARQVTGWTALMGAAEQGHLAVVQALVAHGADVHARYKTGATAWRLAQAQGHTPIVQWLATAGAAKR